MGRSPLLDDLLDLSCNQPGAFVSPCANDFPARPSRGGRRRQRLGEGSADPVATATSAPPTTCRAPSPSAGAATSPLAGFDRTYDTLGHLTSTTARGGSFPAGASWAWGGQGRLYGVTTRGPLGTAARYGYIGGAGPQPPSGTPDARWQLGTLVPGRCTRRRPGRHRDERAAHHLGRLRLRLARPPGRSPRRRKIGRQVQPTDVGLFAGRPRLELGLRRRRAAAPGAERPR